MWTAPPPEYLSDPYYLGGLYCLCPNWKSSFQPFRMIITQQKQSHKSLLNAAHVNLANGSLPAFEPHEFWPLSTGPKHAPGDQDHTCLEGTGVTLQDQAYDCHRCFCRHGWVNHSFKKEKALWKAQRSVTLMKLTKWKWYETMISTSAKLWKVYWNLEVRNIYAIWLLVACIFFKNLHNMDILTM